MSTPIEDYIQAFPENIQKLLWQVHTVIKKLVPEAEEVISYGIPTFKLYGNLVHYAGYKYHIGFYPGASGIEKFKEQLADFKGAKGSVQFPINKEIPFALIAEIVQFRKEENLAIVLKKVTWKLVRTGIHFIKSSECVVCLICEAQRKPSDSILSGLLAPANVRWKIWKQQLCRS